MDRNEQSLALRVALRRWRSRKDSLEHERNPLVLAALEVGITKEEVHVVTGLGRTTIDRIQARAADPESEGGTDE